MASERDVLICVECGKTAEVVIPDDWISMEFIALNGHMEATKLMQNYMSRYGWVCSRECLEAYDNKHKG